MKITDIIKLRKEIHRQPELSNNEFDTVERVHEFVSRFRPDKIISLSKTGRAFVFDSGKKGATLVFRAELDALPIQEESNRNYSSIVTGVSHACGHDGHMAIVAGLAPKIFDSPPKSGKVVLLFQPAEEVEQGARDVINDPGFEEIRPDYLFALHNIPGSAKSKVLLKRGNFAAASKGMTVQLTGKTSHAAEPENGKSPAMAISKIIAQLNNLTLVKNSWKDLVLLTIIHVRLGEIAFGTSPGYAEIMITLRAFRNDDMDLLSEITESIIQDIASQEKLGCHIFYSEEFPAVENNDACFDILESVVKELRLDYEYLKKPYRWSEDFSYYALKYPACFFGLGAGEEHPQLHHPDYDFPDDIVETGIAIFFSIYDQLLVADKKE